MRKCIKTDCRKEATRALKLLFHKSLVDEDPAVAYINLLVCGEHNLTDREMVEFLKLNWVALCAGFMQNAQANPVRELTQWEWRPVEEAEEFWREGLVSLQRNALNN